MREIKFRGIAKEELIGSQWVYGFGIDVCEYTDGTRDLILYTDSYPIAIEEGSEGQYTGLKDKNGRGIYEGDVLQLRNKENKPYHMEVLWTGQGYGYKIIRNDTNLSGYIVGHQSERGINFYNETSEVIGNIYENPALLEESE